MLLKTEDEIQYKLRFNLDFAEKRSLLSKLAI